MQRCWGRRQARCKQVGRTLCPIQGNRHMAGSQGAQACLVQDAGGAGVSSTDAWGAVSALGPGGNRLARGAGHIQEQACVRLRGLVWAELGTQNRGAGSNSA